MPQAPSFGGLTPHKKQQNDFRGLRYEGAANYLSPLIISSLNIVGKGQRVISCARLISVQNAF